MLVGYNLIHLLQPNNINVTTCVVQSNSTQGVTFGNEPRNTKCYAFVHLNRLVHVLHNVCKIAPKQ